METKSPGRSFLPIFVLFMFVSLLILALKQKLAEWNMDGRVLMGGNLVLFLATAISFLLYVRSLQNPNVQVFLRMLYSSLLVKMVLCLAAALLYIFLAGKAVSKFAIIGCFGLYLVYTFAEVRILMRLSKLQKNA
jgi:hypothetical protein